MCGTADGFYSGAVAMANAMKAVGAHAFTFTPFQGVGHSIHDLGYDYPGFIDWMFAQSLPAGADAGVDDAARPADAGPADANLVDATVAGDAGPVPPSTDASPPLDAMGSGGSSTAGAGGSAQGGSAQAGGGGSAGKGGPSAGSGSASDMGCNCSVRERLPARITQWAPLVLVFLLGGRRRTSRRTQRDRPSVGHV
jgi:hypothetical protein